MAWVAHDGAWHGPGGTTVPFAEPRKGMFVGAWNLPGDEPTWGALENQVGRLGIRRSYSPGLPNTAPPVLTQDYGKRATWHSVKADWVQMASGALDNTVASFLDSIPPGHELLLTFAHEPENDNPLAQEPARSAEWRAACHHFYDVVKAARPQTLVGPVLMGWTFNPASGRSVSAWTLDSNKCDFYGVDEYNPYHFPMVGSPDNWVDQPSSTMQAFTNLCASLGVPGAVGETATSEYYGPWSGSRKSAWIDQIFAHAVERDFLALCWFNSYKPGDTSEDMLLGSSQESLAAWAAHVGQHQRGVVRA